MLLSRLLAPLGLHCPEEVSVTHLTCDSRAVRPGSLFVAVDGARARGMDYAREALDRGAAAVLPLERALVAPLAAEFYGHPERELALLAVTGTKGKTTAAYMLREILLRAGHPTGMVGTVGAFAGRELLETLPNTTPEPIALHRLLREMADRGCSHAVMEVSSQAMKQGRAAGITFDGALFLNLLSDHIGPGEHPDREDYLSCKAALFRQCRLAVGNETDPAWPRIRAAVPPGVPVLTFGEPEGLSGWNIALPGRHNARNALGVITLCRGLGLPEEAVRQGLASVSVPGRMEEFPNGRGIRAVIDYAHNGDSVRALLSALRKGSGGRIIALFGAGGSRPPERRREMALAVAEGADLAVVTSDNPRWERAEDICRDIAGVLEGRLPCAVIPDRREAIRFALDRARPGDTVALLGKGHEEYMEVRGERIPFSEREILREYFGQA